MRNIIIWIDVDGVFSVDFCCVKGVKCLNSIFYNEAWEFVYFGVNVFYLCMILLVMKYNILVMLCNYFN